MASEVWVFTFGTSPRHRHPKQPDKSLFFRYVLVSGTWQEARTAIMGIFGTEFSFQYSWDYYGRDMVRRLGLKQIDLTTGEDMKDGEPTVEGG